MNPVLGRITSTFGMRKHPVSGKTSFHNGIDIACKVGTPVMAPEDGVIQDIWEDVNGGKSMSLVSDNGIRFGFAHLSKFISKKPDRVWQGQTIALSGDSGKTTGPHLHLTVKKDGNYIDPLEYFEISEKERA